jgi:hypothetical protein
MNERARGRTLQALVFGFAMAVLSSSSTSAQSGDTCATPLPLALGLTSGSNVGASTTHPPVNCHAFTSDVWYTYTATATGTLIVETCEPGKANFDSMLAAFTGSCGSLSAETCNDNACGFPLDTSWIEVIVTQGETYFIAVGGWNGAEGNYTINVEFVPPPPNDDCANALPAFDGINAGTTEGALTSPAGASCDLEDEVWLSYKAICTGPVSVSTCSPGSSEFYSSIAVFDGTCGALTEMECSETGCGLGSYVVFNAVSGTTYLLAVGSQYGWNDEFELMIECVSPLPNDECAGALPISPGVTFGNTLGATTSLPTVSCDVSGEVWYSYTAPANGFARVDTCWPGYSTFSERVAVFSGSCGSLVELLCTGSCDQSFPTSAGQTYLIAVGGGPGNYGSFGLELQWTPEPTNDDCSSGTVLLSNVPVEGWTLGASAGAGSSCVHPGSEVWYSWQAPITGLGVVEADGITTSPDLTVYEGACGALIETACSSSNTITFPATAGETYQIAVATPHSEGSFTIEARGLPAISNETCETAMLLSDGLVLGDTTGASSTLSSEPICELSHTVTNHDVWYRYTAPQSGWAWASVCDNGGDADFFRPHVRVFEDSCAPLVAYACDNSLSTCGQLFSDRYSEAKFPVEAGVSYLIAVGGGVSHSTGPFTLSIQSYEHWAFSPAFPSGVEGAAAGLKLGEDGDYIILSHGFVGYDTADVWEFDLEEEVWDTFPSAAVARAELAGAVVGGFYYALGGRAGLQVVDVLEVFDTETEIWTLATPMPTARAALGLATLDGRLHAIGGRTGTIPHSGSPLGAHEVFDPASNTWSSRAPLPVPVADCYATVAVDGKIYVFGGWDGNQTVDLTQIYDPTTDLWSSGAPMPTARENAAVGVLGSGAFAGWPVVIGGVDDSGKVLRTVEAYDPSMDSWSAGESKPAAAAELVARAPDMCDAIHLIGSGPGGALGMYHERFVPSPTEQWSDLGLGLAGTYGVPVLQGSGTLCIGADTRIEMNNAKEFAVTAFLLGASQLNFPKFGGIIVPDPLVILYGLAADGNGELLLMDAPFPDFLPSGLDLYLQAWVQDPVGSHGWAATNGLLAQVP